MRLDRGFKGGKSGEIGRQRCGLGCSASHLGNCTCIDRKRYLMDDGVLEILGRLGSMWVLASGYLARLVLTFVQHVLGGVQKGSASM